MKEQDAAHSFEKRYLIRIIDNLNAENADLKAELTRLRSELQQAKQEIANHTMVNNLLLDGDDDAKIANVIYNLVCELNKAKSELAPVERAFLAGRSQTSWKQFQEDEKAKLNN